MAIVDKLYNYYDKDLLKEVKKIHFIGIGGSGMSGIAEVALQRGYQVSGSDMKDSLRLRALAQSGATIYIGHIKHHIDGADLVVVSTAIDQANAELIAAKNKNIPIVHRAKMLSELMLDRFSIAIGGTHGKTTTSGLLSYMLEQAGCDPTYIVGGLLNNTGTNAKLGNGEYFVAEADESDASFLYLHPQISVLTNIDSDHLWFYEDDFNCLKETFCLFLQNLSANGLAILCVDDPHIRQLLPTIQKNKITYGMSQDADVKILDYHQEGLTTSFKIHHTLRNLHYSFQLNLPGKHNVLNATAVICVALELGIELEHIQRGLQTFQGTGRRFHIRGEYNFGHGQALVVDDYGHHPREIAATMAAAKAAWPNRRLVHVFQPQRYSRTKDLFQDFVNVLAESDHLVLLDIYPADEKPIPGVSSEAICDEIARMTNKKPVYLSRNAKIAELLPSILQNDDILLMQGAGDVSGMAVNLVTSVLP